MLSINVVTREWADVRSNMDLVVYGGYFLRPPHRGFIAVFQFNHCTGARRPTGFFSAPPRTRPPVLESVQGNLIRFRAGNSQGSFNFNVKGNDYRLVTWIDFEEQYVVMKWFGTHAEYDRGKWKR